MHTEHLQNVRAITVIAAWLVSVAVTSLIMLALVGLNLIDADSPSVRAAMAAIAFGFIAGGVFAGVRAAQAPILHGVAIGLFSLVAWFILGVLSQSLFNGTTWDLTRDLTITSVIVQIIASIIGARLGYRLALRGNV
ncbi:MAG TPA: hypothetical protein VGD27_18075 [Longimicrobiales bacterium]